MAENSLKHGAAAAGIYWYPVEEGNICPRCPADLIFIDHVSWRRHVQGHGGIDLMYQCRRCQLSKPTLSGISSHYVHCRKKNLTQVDLAGINTLEPETEGYRCRFCERIFTKKTGRGVHEQRVHRAMYESSQVQSSRGHWSEEEKRILAEAEARQSSDLREMNIALRDVLPGRKFEAIKSRRKTSEHRALVLAIRASQASDDNDTGSSDSSLEFAAPEPLGLALELENLLEDSGMEKITRFFIDHSDDEDPLVALLCQGVVDKTFTLESVKNLFPEVNVPASNRKDYLLNTHLNPRKARQRRFRFLQRLFKLNKRRLVKELLENFDELPAKPSEEDIMDTYGGLFSKPSQLDDEDVIRRPRKTDMYYPITIEEVQKALRKCSSSTPGPDGLTLQWLKNANIKMLTCVFNFFLLEKDLPAYLKVARTVLLPKKGDLGLASNWRPITISSLLVRVFHGILARRLILAVDLHPAQQAFLPTDGISANSFLIDYIISNAKRKKKNLSLISIDVSKAFDSVSHHSIDRALRAAGLEEGFISYIKNSYLDCWTSISCGSVNTAKFRVTNGVKQGDPLSPIIFNCIMDELVRSLPAYIGVEVDGALSNIVSFADDIVLASSSKDGMRVLLNCLQDFLEKRGLLVNARKCAALNLVKLGKAKKVINDTQATFTINNNSIPAITYDNMLTYLGVPYSPDGKCRPALHAFYTELKKLADAPLKAQQKIELLRDYVMPRHLHYVTFSFFCKKDLNAMDTAVKAFCRRFLRLPHYSPEGFFYVKQSSGGLGLMSFSTSIPLHLLSRIGNLQHSTSPVVRRLYDSKYIQSTKNRAASLLQGFGESKAAVQEYWEDRLYNTVYGAGLRQARRSPISNSFLLDFSRAKNTKQFCSWIKTRLNLLPCRGAPSNQGEKNCRACRTKIESLSHISNACPLSKSKFVARHDKFVNLLRKSSKRRDVVISVEPRLTDRSGNLYKPDLVVVSQEEVIVCDVACPWETPRSISSAYKNKVTTYDTPEMRNIISTTWPNRAMSFCAFVVSARGVWCEDNKTICDYLELGLGFRKLCTQIALEQTYLIYQSFMNAVHYY